jgi:phosphatidylglycerophosphate synthase
MQRLSWDGYAAAWAGLHGGFDVRQATPAVRGWLRLGYGVGSVLSRLRVSPTTITAAGLVLCVLVPLAARRGGGWVFLAALLVVLAAVADTVDGAIAVIASRATPMGSVYDSVADRIGEACWVAAFWVLGVPGPLAVGCCAVGWLHEYVRARATALPQGRPAALPQGRPAALPPGRPAADRPMTAIGAVTWSERPSRVLVVLIGLLLAGGGGLVSVDLSAAVVTLVATGWLLLGVFGLSQLFGAVRQSLH